MTKNKFAKIPFLFFFVLLSLLSCFVLKVPSVAFADTVSEKVYTDVLEDLKRNKNFSQIDYVRNDADYSLDVITIAESSDKELFVYVYQPSAYNVSLKASSINISTGVDVNYFPKNYGLTFLNSEGVFHKYKVNDFVVKDDALRYYDIPSIFRPYDSVLDRKLPNGNENVISEVSFEIGRLYTASTVEGKTSFTCLDSETVLITDKYVGFVQYANGFELFPGEQCRSHFVAFSTDYNIEKLLEADVYYVSREAIYNYIVFGGGDYEYKTPEEKYVYLKYTDEVTHEGSGWFGKTYTWNRIESAESFIEKEELTEEAKIDLAGKEWVLRFAESSYQIVNFDGGFSQYYTDINDVTILRLKFETEGKVYNLGVVDNKQSQSSMELPDNEQLGQANSCTELSIKEILFIAGFFALCGILFIIFAPVILPLIGKLIIWVVKMILKGVLYAVKIIVLAPIYLIRWIKEKFER